jgi:hypothetical protein
MAANETNSSVYPLEHIESAMRFLQSGKSYGKVDLKVNKDAVIPVD